MIEDGIAEGEYIETTDVTFFLSKHSSQFTN